MMRLYYTLILLFAVLAVTSCKKFLDVAPADRTGSSSFWQTREDVESAVINCYGFVFEKFNDFNSPVIPAVGDMRCGGIGGVVGAGQLGLGFKTISNNDLSNTTDLNVPERYNLVDIDDWAPYFESIANCNITLSEIEKMEALTDDEKNRYEAEVKFVRAFTYFYICRLYGDVPFYTEPYDKTPRPRTSFVTIFNTLIAELDAVKDDLPWTPSNTSDLGVRANRASIYTLIAHLNMWVAGFDKANQNKYWQDAAQKCLAVKNSGEFELLPLEETKRIFKGKTKESIFEFELNRNYGNTSRYVNLGQWMTHSPIVNYGANSDLFFSRELMERIYPPDKPDKRRDIWFYLPYVNNQTFMFLKQINVADPAGDWIFEDNLMIFRYADVLLLGAEAFANLNNNTEAISMLNMVRERAGANLFAAGAENLSDAIFWERQKELIGEGHRWYDFVRTGRVLDPNQALTYLTQEEFDRGAWTWPIDAKARINNPEIVLNLYWVR
ncbi:RagB/SusD family nutrient uptake outer membrane protein [Niabella ginsengisoli]|uniref:RagB/SusD family nutrient uptake outer membrane protein n=1 Tax=Niabella ginsengisoli TaxID=522298 RepID=A0ABS9SIU8_9BACT|nr:RagB/SusD family nutrient uptake outer membrane protein [Niabella ginsengisoli]MCH5598275.1 RagB/SusD family nutrient uptake outer membrane protein [Niabella ginsengisoli]